MPVCPNGLEAAEISDSDLQHYYALFREHVDNEDALRYAVESRESTEEGGVQKYAPYLLPGFSPTQREEVVKMFQFLIDDSIQAIQGVTGKQEGFGLGDIRHLATGFLTDRVKDLQNDALVAEGEELESIEAQIEEHQKILDNFDHFFEEALDRYEGIGMTRREGRLYPSFNEAEGQDWDDNKRFSSSSKDTASTHLKAVLSFIPEVDFLRENGKIVREQPKTRKVKDEKGRVRLEVEETTPQALLQPRKNYLGYNSYMNMSEAWNKAAYLLTDVFPRTPENMLETLRERGENDAVALALYKTLVTKSEETLHALSNALGKHYATFKLIWGRKGDDGLQLQPIDQDRFSRGRALLSSWKSGFFGGNLTVQGRDGEQRLNTEKVQQVHDRLLKRRSEMDIQSDEFREAVFKAFQFMGMEMPMDYLRAAQEGEANFGQGWVREFSLKTSGTSFSKGSFMGRLFQALDSRGENVSAHSVNPVEHERTAPVLKKISSAAADYTKDIYAPSSTNAEGNRIHAVQDHEPLTRTFQEIQDPEASKRLIRDPFITNSFLGRILAQMGLTDEEFGINQQERHHMLMDSLDFDYVGGLSIQGRKQGQGRDQLSSVDRDIHQMSFFQNGGQNTRHVIGPTLSDKQRSYVLRIPNLKALANGSSPQGRPNRDDLWNADISIEGGELTIDATGDVGLERLLYWSALSEINRVVEMNKWLDQNNRSDHDLGAKYTQAAELFYLFPELNYHRIEDESLRDDIYDDSGANPRIKNPEANDVARDAIIQVLFDKLHADAEETYSEWVRRDIQDQMNDQYLDRQTPFNPTSEEAKIFAALDITATDKLMIPEFHRFFHGDPAQFFKGDAPSVDGNSVSMVDRPEAADFVADTIGNMDKRLAKEMAPAGTSGMDEEATFTQATIQDLYTGAKNIDVLEELLGEHADAYREDNIESTDAQELTTTAEWLRVANAYNEISQENFEEAMRQIEEGGDYRLSDELMEKILVMTHKGIYVGRRWDEELQQYIEVYTKISAIPLLPNIVGGTQLDKLRKAMETGGTDRVVYESGQKLGKVNPTRVFEEDGAVRDQESLMQDLENSKQTLRRKDFGLQFRIPQKTDKIAQSTQANKLFLADSMDTGGFKVAGKEGEMTGRELFEMKEENRIEQMELGKQGLLNDLNAKVHDSGKITVDPQRLKELILEEAEERDWSLALMERIERFASEDMKVPLSFSGGSTRIESLLLSLIEKRVIKSKMHGRSYAQATSAGMLWDSALNTGDIVFTEDFDPTGGLNFVDVTEDQEVVPAQVVVPWHFKDSDGNVLNMEDYTKTLPGGRKVLDEEKIDPEVRKAITHRIPYQGPNSHLPMEIVGFLPPNLWSVSFVPPEITVQMGSDFDVDKLNAYLTRYMHEGNTLSKIRDDASRKHQLQQEYADIMWAGATNVNSLKNNLMPLDQDDLKNEIEVMGSSDREFDYTHPLYRNRAMDSQQAGNQLIGMTSLWSQLEVLLQISPVDLDFLSGNAEKQGNLGITVQKASGSELTMTKAGGGPSIQSSHSPTALTAHHAMKLYQSAAVDNSKENILGPLNVSMDNIGPVMTLLMLSNQNGTGVDIEHATRLMNQPIIRSLMKRVQRKQSMFENVSNREAMTQAINEVRDNLDVPLPGEAQGRLDDPETMLSHIKNPDSESNTYQRAQANYLQVFQDLTRYAQGFDVMRAAYVFGDRKGAGKNMIEALKHKKILNEELTKQPFKNPHAIGEGREQGEAAQNSFILADDMYSDLFAYDADSFQKVWTDVEHLQDRNLTANELEDAFQDFRAFTVLSTFDGDLKALRERLLFGEAYAGGRTPINMDFSSQMAEMAMDGETFQIVFDPNPANRFPIQDKDTGVTFAGEQRVLVTREGARDEDGKILFTVEPTDAQPDLATRINEARADGWGEEHLFLQLMDPTPPMIEEEAVIDGQKTPVLSPAEITFRSIKMEDTDQPRILQDIAQMLSSPDAKRQKLARDLMLYQIYARGWKRGPRDFGELIPTAYFDDIGVIEKLADHNVHDEPWTAHRFVRQFLQHNPQKAKVLSDNELNSLPGKGDRLPSQFIPEPEAFPTSMIDGDGDAYEYVSYYDAQFGRWRLYHEQEGQYSELDVLGDSTKRSSGNVEYDPSSQMVKSSFVPQAGVSNIKRATNRTQQTPINKSLPDSAKKKKVSSWRRYLHGDDLIADVVERIAEDNDIDGSLQQVARTLGPILKKTTGDIPVRVNHQLAGAARFSDGRVDFNPKKGSGHEFFARQLLHEAMHALSTDRLSLYLAIKDGQRSRKETGMTGREFQAFQHLDSLYDEGRKALIEEIGKEAFNDGIRKIRQVQSGEISEAQLTNQERTLIYPLSTQSEFIAQVITNEEFQAWANDVSTGATGSLFERIAQAFTALVKSLSSALGIDVQQKSLLGRGIKETLTLLQQRPSRARTRDRKSPPPSKSSRSDSRAHEVDLKGQTWKILLQSSGAIDVYSEKGTKIKQGKIKREVIAKFKGQQEAKKQHRRKEETDPEAKERTQPTGQPSPDASESIQSLINRRKNQMSFSVEGLGMSVGEFMNSLSAQERATFRELRNQIITRC